MKTIFVSENVQSLRQQIIYARTTSRSLSFELARQVGEEEGYLFENAKEFASLLLRIVEGLELNLELEYQRELLDILNKDQTRQSDNEQEVRRVRQRVVETVQISAEMTDMLKYIDGAKAIENPWGVIAEIDRLCRNLNSRARVIPYPRWEYNYRYYPISHKLWRISELANAQDSRIHAALTRLLADSPYYFSLQFPPTSRPNLLQMAMWGHELGHFIDNIEGMTSGNIESPFDYQIAYMSQQRANEIVRNTLPVEIIRDLIDSTRFSDEAKIVEVLQNYNERIGELIFQWAREVFADLYSVHLFGPAAIFSLVEFVQPLTTRKTKYIDSSYPPFEMRLKLILEEYEKWLSTDPEIENLVRESTPEDTLGILRIEMERLKSLVPELPDILVHDDNFVAMENYFDVIYPYMIEILKIVVSDFSQHITTLKEENPECYLKPKDLNRIARSVIDLESGVPPALIPDPFDELDAGVRLRILPLIINSGWLHWLKVLHRTPEAEALPSEEVFMQNEFEKLNYALLKAVEENVAIQWFSENSRFTEADPLERTKEDRAFMEVPLTTQSGLHHYSGVLRRSDILAEMSTGALLVRPLISPSSQIHETSIDIRLGNEFTVMKRSALTKQDPIQIQKDPSFIDHQSKHFVPFGKPFVLHPWQFISVSCLEFLKIPKSCVGWITNRRWWTKLGLVYVGSEDLPPGFRGQIVLELTNFGNAPILLYPGSRICSLYLIPINRESLTH